MDINEIRTLFNYIARKNTSSNAWANKDQFNLMINRASITKFLRLFGKEEQYFGDKAVPRIAYSKTLKINEDLRPFLKEEEVVVDSEGKSVFPTDYYYPYDAFYKRVENGEEVFTTIELVEPQIENYRRTSRVVTPTFYKPIAVPKADHIQFRPLNLRFATVQYLKIPADMIWGGTVSGTQEIYDAALSTQPEWGDAALNDIVSIALSYIGISVKDTEVQQYSELKQQQGT